MLMGSASGGGARNARERWLIGGGVAALLVSALWAYVWSPIAAERARLIAVASGTADPGAASGPASRRSRTPSRGCAIADGGRPAASAPSKKR